MWSQDGDQRLGEAAYGPDGHHGRDGQDGHAVARCPGPPFLRLTCRPCASSVCDSRQALGDSPSLRVIPCLTLQWALDGRTRVIGEPNKWQGTGGRRRQRTGRRGGEVIRAPKESLSPLPAPPAGRGWGERREGTVGSGEATVPCGEAAPVRGHYGIRITLKPRYQEF